MNTAASPPSVPAGAALDRSDSDVVLIVDDVPDNLAVLHDALDESGYTVLVAMHGEAALQRAAQALPDIVLLDAMMPGMDGFEVARRLREHHASECTPIIFVTAMTDDASRHQGLSLGAIDYVFKPIEPELLHLRVSNLMYYVEHRKQLQKDFDQMHENSRLQAELERMRVELQRLRGG